MDVYLLRRYASLAGVLVGLAAAVVFLGIKIHDTGWTFFLQLTVNGVTLGSVYALIALGYSMVYGILKLLNFAHGDVYMVGSFIGFGLITVFGGAEAVTVNVVLLLFLMFAAAMLGCAIL